MNMNEKLDAIFFFIKNKTNLGASVNKKYIWNLYVEKTPELQINWTLFNDILDRLIKDEYVTISDDTYHVTVKGREFKGYVEDAQWYRWIVKNPIGQGILIGLITALIIWAVSFLSTLNRN